MVVDVVISNSHKSPYDIECSLHDKPLDSNGAPCGCSAHDLTFLKIIKVHGTGLIS